LIRPFEVRLTDPTLAAKTKARRGWGTQERLIHLGRINKLLSMGAFARYCQSNKARVDGKRPLKMAIKDRSCKDDLALLTS
jgi:hypothetical protein